jgi:Ca-activated chloride channel homolog
MSEPGLASPTHGPRRAWLRPVPVAFGLVGLVLLAVAITSPTGQRRVPNGGVVVLAVDVSLSMAANDVAPTRLAAAQAGALTFVDRAGPEVAIGLVTFSGVARTVVEPTRDHDRVRVAIDELILAESTAIGEAIYAGLGQLERAGALDNDGQATEGTAIVVLSDGKTTVGRHDADAAADAAEAGVPVSTISLGTDRGFIRTELLPGRNVAVPVAPEPLRMVAELTGGRFAEAPDAATVRDIYEDLATEVGAVEVPTDQRLFYSAGGVACLALAVFTGAGIRLGSGRRAPAPRMGTPSPVSRIERIDVAGPNDR